MKAKYLPLILGLLFSIGCSKLPEGELWKKAETARENGNADSVIQVCQTLIKEYPDGKIAPAATYLIAEMYQNSKKDPRAAIQQYRFFVRKYPDLQQTPVAYFLIGFLENNELKELDSARAAYETFLAKFPKHELAESAKFELSTLGKTPEEIMKEKEAPPPAIARKARK
jgi:TolA-binding protein